MVLQAELPRVFTDNLHVLPSQSFKSLASYLAQRWGEVDEVDARKESRDIDKLRHGLDIVAGATTNLRGVSLGRGSMETNDLHRPRFFSCSP
jgi:hypothetical protein